jgi:hypothetical protein
LGTGDVGPELISETGMVMEKQAGLYGRDYFSVFGKVKVPRTCYRGQTPEGVMPLDAKANLPSRCYSYLLQEWMDIFDIRDGFKESQISLNKLPGLEISQSRFEIVNLEWKCGESHRGIKTNNHKKQKKAYQYANSRT